MYLSRLMLNPTHRQVQHDLADCHELHRTVMSAFPNIESDKNDARAALCVLYRVDTSDRTGRINLLVQSGERPDWSHLPRAYLIDSGSRSENPAIKDISVSYQQIGPGTPLVFRLRANPTKRVSARSTTERSGAHGKRVDLRSEAEQLAWLARKGDEGGFNVIAVQAHPDVSNARVIPGGQVHGRHQHGRLTFGSVIFEGSLRVTDPDRFLRTLATGIGSGKAYGFGLLSIASPRALEE